MSFQTPIFLIKSKLLTVLAFKSEMYEKIELREV